VLGWKRRRERAPEHCLDERLSVRRTRPCSRRSAVSDLIVSARSSISRRKCEINRIVFPSRQRADDRCSFADSARSGQLTARHDDHLASRESARRNLDLLLLGDPQLPAGSSVAVRSRPPPQPLYSSFTTRLIARRRRLRTQQDVLRDREPRASTVAAIVAMHARALREGNGKDRRPSRSIRPPSAW